VQPAQVLSCLLTPKKDIFWTTRLTTEEFPSQWVCVIGQLAALRYQWIQISRAFQRKERSGLEGYYTGHNCLRGQPHPSVELLRLSPG
jgi:hypothetical protein